MSQPMPVSRRLAVSCKRGFTLMELLVVIAIIAVLISFLLPALSQARRESNKAKCLSALKDLGSAFNIYATEFKQAWPVVQHTDTSKGGNLPMLGAEPGERHWGDLLAKYAGGQKLDMKNYKDIEKLKNAKSNIWGCPEWVGGAGVDATIHSGYGMNYIANAGDFRNGGNARQNSMAWISMRTTGIFGAYHKTSTWGKFGAQKLLLADSQVYYVWMPYTGGPGNFPADKIKFQGYVGSSQGDPLPVVDDPAWVTPLNQDNAWIDGGRHLKPGMKRLGCMQNKGINALFTDGHAATIGVADAWAAIYFPGTGKN